MTMPHTLFCFGFGYCAQYLTPHLIRNGWTVTGTTRSEAGVDRIRAAGAEPLIWPGGDIATPMGHADHLLISAAPDADGDPVLAGMASAIADLAPGLRWVGYLSTTGVYGDRGGGWVDETTPLAPTTRRGRHRVRAEADWQSLAGRCGLPLHIFRLAGIYGPGRGPFAKVRNNTARRIIKENQVFSRIHVEDIARVLLASIRRPDPGAIYNVCDDLAAPPQDVIAHAARLLGMPLPPAIPFDQADMSPMAKSFYAESKRVRNDRIKSELGVKLLYPDYEVGLEELLKAELNPEPSQTG